MATTTPQTKTKSQAKRTKTTKATAIRWRVAETMPRRRWWWWAAVGYICLTLTVGLIGFGQWLLGILVATIFLAIIVTYGTKPPTRNYVLDGDTLTIDDMTIELARYNRFIIDDPWQTTNGEVLPETSIQLLPKAFFGTSRVVILPTDLKKAETVFAAINRHIPLNEDDSYVQSSRVLRRIGRWLRIG